MVRKSVKVLLQRSFDDDCIVCSRLFVLVASCTLHVVIGLSASAADDISIFSRLEIVLARPHTDWLQKVFHSSFFFISHANDFSLILPIIWAFATFSAPVAVAVSSSEQHSELERIPKVLQLTALSCSSLCFEFSESMGNWSTFKVDWSFQWWFLYLCEFKIKHFDQYGYHH